MKSKSFLALAFFLWFSGKISSRAMHRSETERIIVGVAK